MLFPMDESVFVGDLASRLSVESDIGSLKSVLLALWYTATPTGKAAIKNFIESSRGPEDAKTYAKGLLNRKLPPLSSISFPSVDALRHERRKVMHRPISDEALIEFDKLTAKLLSTQ